MKTKSLTFSTFMILFIACSFHYLLMITACNVEKDALHHAKAYAATAHPVQREYMENKLVVQYLDSIANEVIFNIPYLCNYTYLTLKKHQLKLGHDLGGGLQLSIGFDMEHFIEEVLGKKNDKNIKQALSHTQSDFLYSSEEFIAAFFENYSTIVPEADIIDQIYQNGKVLDRKAQRLNYYQVIFQVQSLSKEKISQTYTIIKNRIQALGLHQTRVSIDQHRSLVHLEIYGIKNPETIKQLLTQKASLEFWDTYRFTDDDIYSLFFKADDLLKAQSCFEY